MSERQTATGRRDTRLRLESELGRRSDGHGGSASQRHPADDLSICPHCSRNLVYPTEWAPAGPYHWVIQMRCPECEWRGGGTHHQDLIDRFDEALDDGTQSLLDDLELLTRSNMEEQIERFVDALERDLILAEDF